MLLDLSAAFDTIDHYILLNRLEDFVGISGSALAWSKMQQLEFLLEPGNMTTLVRFCQHCTGSLLNIVDFKILLITYKALNGLAPQYLSKLLSHYSPPRPLRSQNSGHLIIPRISKSTAGGRTFFYLAPKLWNNLPNTVREAETLCQFKSRLKTHLFNLVYT